MKTSVFLAGFHGNAGFHVQNRVYKFGHSTGSYLDLEVSIFRKNIKMFEFYFVTQSL
jgi:hypothetical protein